MDRLRKKRVGLRGTAMHLLSAVGERLRKPDPAPSDWQAALDDLQRKEAAINELDKKIDERVDDEGLEEEVAGAVDYRDKLGHAASRVRFALQPSPAPNPHEPGDIARRNQPSGASGGDPQETDAGHVHIAPVQRATMLRVSLTKLHIPTFTGELAEWHRFWEHFEATINVHPDLPSIEKFKYLRSYLTEAAKKVIDRIRLTGKNYSLAIQILAERFGRREVLIDEHIDCLLSMSSIESPKEVSRLR